MNPQKSEVHETTGDASTSPATEFERGAADKDMAIGQRAEEEPNPGQAVKEANNPEKAFPEGVHVKRDESDIGGPIDVEVDTRE